MPLFLFILLCLFLFVGEPDIFDLLIDNTKDMLSQQATEKDCDK
jgi:hypothetical protein